MDTVLIDGGAITVLPENVYAMTVHAGLQCAGRTCVIHAPTEHPMRSWKLHWRSDRGIFERLCPHGTGHPDPDQQAYWREQAERGEILDEVDFEDDYDLAPRHPDEHVAAMMVHGCDGCCTP